MRLLGLIYNACVTVFFLTLLVASQSYGSNCEPTLSSTADAWRNLGAVGRRSWCEQYTVYDEPNEKPGRPCVCVDEGVWMASGTTSPTTTSTAGRCNPLLDPDAYDAAIAADDESWCQQWSHAPGVPDWLWLVQSDQPCECLYFFQRFQWRLLLLIDIVVLR